MRTRHFRILLATWMLSFTQAPLAPQDDDEPKARIAIRNPQITTVFPMGARLGSTVDVEVRGEFLDEASSICFVEKDVSAIVRDASFTRIRMEVRVSPDAAPGPRYFRAVTPRGATNLLLFRVSQWPSLLEEEPNDELETLRPIEWPGLISGKLQTPRDVDLFRFRGRAGERIGLHLLAYRNWSTSDLSLAVLDANRRALRQDEGTFIWDPYIDFSCPTDGEYIAAVMLTRMPAGGQSGRDLVYQLAIGPMPVLVSVFPLALEPGASTKLNIRGDYIENQKGWWIERGNVDAIGAARPSANPNERAAVHLTVAVAQNPRPDRTLFGIKHPSGAVSPLSVNAAAAPTRKEMEPNDTAQSAESIPIPVTINGKIQSRTDEDFFAFEVEAGESLVFDVDAEKLGSRLDARIVLLNSNGKSIANADDSKGGVGPLKWDPLLEHTFKEPGKYFARIYNLQRRGGEDWVYALTVRRPAPDVVLRLGNERLAVPRGEKASWSVNVERKDGYKGPVAIEVSGLPTGVEARPLVIAEDQSSGKLEISASPGAKIGLQEVRVTGKATIAGEQRWRVAEVPAARAEGSGPGYFEYRSTTAWLSVVEARLFSLESAASEVFVIRGGTAEFGVKVSRRFGFDGSIEFSLENAPQGVEVQKVETVDEGRIARITLAASENARVGRTSEVTIIGTAIGGGVRRSESAPRISIQVD